MLLYAMLLFAAFFVITGAIGLIPRKNTVLQPDSPEATEVFLPISEELSMDIFASFRAPLKGAVTSSYGYRPDPFTGKQSYHNGVDLAAKEGSDVCAAESGIVKSSAYDEVGGHYIIIAHEN